MSKLLEQINTKRKTFRLGDIVGVNERSITNNFPHSEIEYIDTSSVVGNRFNKPEVLNIKEAPSRAKRLVKDGDTIISTVRPNLKHYGFIKNPKENTVVSTGFAVLTPREIDPFYLFSYLTQESITNTLTAIAEATTTTFPAFRPEVLADMEIEVPDLLTQKKIAEILSAYDAKIENNNIIIKKLETIAQTIFNERFVKSRLTENERVNKSIWLKSKLGDLCDISIGRTPPREQKQWFSRNPSDIRWISIKDLGLSGVYISDTDECLTREAVQKFNIPVIPKNTLILSFKLTVGRVAITSEEMLSNEAIAHLKIADGSYITTEYLYCLMKNYDYGSLASTSSIATAVNSKTIKNIEVEIPPKELVNSFTQIAAPLFKSISQIQIENRKLKITRDQLLTKLI